MNSEHKLAKKKNYESFTFGSFSQSIQKLLNTYNKNTTCLEKNTTSLQKNTICLQVYIIANGKNRFECVSCRLQKVCNVPSQNIHHIAAIMVDDPDIVDGKSGYRFPQEHGVFLSHMAALDRFEEFFASKRVEVERSRSPEYLLVLEEDVHFCVNFEKKLLEYLRSVEENGEETKSHLPRIFKLGNNCTYGGSWGTYALLFPKASALAAARHFRENTKTNPKYRDAIDRVMNLKCFLKHFEVVDIPKQKDLVVPDISSSSIRGPRNQLSKGWRLENFPTMTTFTMQRFVFVIPLYNVEKYITKCLESVLAQTYKRFRVVLVDDCSTDDSAKIISKVLAKEEHQKVDVVFFKNTERRGQAWNRYRVYSDRSLVSLEDVCVFLDGDDWLKHDDALRLAALCMVENQADAAFTSFEYYNPQERTKSVRFGRGTKPALTGGSLRYHRRPVASHPRFFHAALVNQIEYQDLFCPAISRTQSIRICTDINENMVCLDFATSPRYFGNTDYTHTPPLVMYNKENSLLHPESSYYTTKLSRERLTIENWIYSPERNLVDLENIENLRRAGRINLLPFVDGVVVLDDEKVRLKSNLLRDLSNLGFGGLGKLLILPYQGKSVQFLASILSYERPAWERVLFVQSSSSLSSIRGLAWVPFFFATCARDSLLVLGTSGDVSRSARKDTYVPMSLSTTRQMAAGNGIRALICKASSTAGTLVQKFPATIVPKMYFANMQKKVPTDSLYALEEDVFCSRDTRCIKQQNTNQSCPLLSVVIVTRNRARYLKDAIRSTLEQSYTNFELLVVDDGSRDDTVAVVKSFRSEKIFLYTTEPLGIPKARNLGVQKATGEYIVIMDDDDIMLPNRLQQHIDCLTVGSAGSHGGWINVDICNEKREKEFCPGGPHGYSQILFGHKILLHPASMIKRQILLEFPYDENFLYGTDYIMNLEIARAGYRLDHTRSYVLLRRLHSQNVTATNSKEQRNAAKLKWKEHVQGLSDAAEKKLREESRNTKYFDDILQPNLEEHFSWLSKDSKMD